MDYVYCAPPSHSLGTGDVHAGLTLAKLEGPLILAGRV